MGQQAAARGYLNFDLFIERQGEGYRARVLAAAWGEAEARFDPPFAAEEYEALADRIDRSRARMRRVATPQLTLAKEMGARLFNAALSSEIRASLARALDDAQAREARGVRIRLHLDAAPELAVLPWEFAFDSDPRVGRFLALAQETPVVRYVSLPQRVRPLTVSLPLKVLVIVANPVDDRFLQLDVEREWHLLDEALAQQREAGRIEVTRLPRGTLSALQDELTAHDYHVLHFTGHGRFDEGHQDGLLAFEGERGGAREVSAERFGALLHNVTTLRLAVLNACEGGRASVTDAYAGMAQTLVRMGVPAVIAMQFEISDEAAIMFGRQFYRGVALGLPVDNALTDARMAIYQQVSELEWATPVLYMRSPDGQIFDIRAAAPVIAPLSVGELLAPIPEAAALTEAPTLAPTADGIQTEVEPTPVVESVAQVTPAASSTAKGAASSTVPVTDSAEVDSGQAKRLASRTSRARPAGQGRGAGQPSQQSERATERGARPETAAQTTTPSATGSMQAMLCSLAIFAAAAVIDLAYATQLVHEFDGYPLPSVAQLHNVGLAWITLGTVGSVIWLFGSTAGRLAPAALVTSAATALWATVQLLAWAPELVPLYVVTGAIEFTVMAGWCWWVGRKAWAQGIGTISVAKLSMIAGLALMAVSYALTVAFAIISPGMFEVYLCGLPCGFWPGGELVQEAGIFLIATGIIEWRILGAGRREDLGMAQVILFLCAGLLWALSAIANPQGYHWSIAFVPGVLALAIFAVRVGRQSLSVSWRSPAADRFFSAGIVFLVLTLSARYLIDRQTVMATTYYEGGDYWRNAVELTPVAHTALVGLITNLLFGLLVVMTKDRPRVWPWAEHVIFWGVNAGALALTSSEVLYLNGLDSDEQGIVRAAAIVFDVTALVGIGTCLRRLISARVVASSLARAEQG